MTNVDLCAVANLLAVLRGVKFGYSVLISFHVGILLIFDSAPDQFQDLVVEILYFGLSKRNAIVQIFSFECSFVSFDKYDLCLSIVLRLFCQV